VKLASRIAFGNQTIFLPSEWTKVEDSRLCVPTSRQVCLFGAFKDQWWTLGIKGGQTELNNLNPKLSTVILKGFVPWMCDQLGQSGWLNRAYSASTGSLTPPATPQVILTFVPVNRRGLPKKWKWSAKGAEYESQGQARREA
jgi:hypothetical protein